MLLARLFRFRASNVVDGFHLACPIHDPQSRTIRVTFITRVDFRTSRLRNLCLRLRNRVTGMDFVVRPRLVRLGLFRPFLVRLLIMLNFHALGVGLRRQDPYLRTISTPTMRFRGAYTSQQNGSLLGYQGCFSKDASARFRHPTIRNARGRILLVRTTLRR